MLANSDNWQPITPDSSIFRFAGVAPPTGLEFRAEVARSKSQVESSVPGQPRSKGIGSMHDQPYSRRSSRCHFDNDNP